MRLGNPRSIPFPLLLTLLILVFVCLPNDGHAQSVPVTNIENAAGDSVLTVFEDGGFAAYGEVGTGTIPSEGEGTRVMWYPAKAAFRAGRVDTEWNVNEIGETSVAFGSNTEASGSRSTALGNGTTASAFAATAMGEQTEASGRLSTAMGFLTTASDRASTAMGNGTTASGIYATAMGQETEASGWQSTAMGKETKAIGRQSTAMGRETEASGQWSTAMGVQTIASGSASTAMGGFTTAATEASLTTGLFNDANRGNDDSDPLTGPLVVVGNGSSPTNRSDALVLDQSGNLEISGTLTENSDRRLKEQIQPLGTGVLAPLGEIEPVRFQFKDERTHPSGEQVGLIAQEVQAQFPALVSEGASGHLSVSYSKFTAVLLKGLQEQQAKIERLEARQAKVASLRKENEAIKKRLARLEQGGMDAAAFAGWGPTAPLGGLVVLLLLAGGVVAWRRFDALSSIKTLSGLGMTGLLVIGGFLAAPAGEVRAQTRVLDIDEADGDSLVHVNDDGGFAVYGEGGTGVIPAEGEGTRMMWFPEKSAFRAGKVGAFSSGDEWNEPNVGYQSVAFGENTVASGENSTAMGSGTIASDDASTAMGQDTDAGGIYSTAMGQDTDASGVSSVAMGDGSIASGDESTAMGYYTEASGDESTAMGDATDAATDHSLSIGTYNDANRGNDDDNRETGPLFVVGNGVLGSRSDALVLQQTGSMTIAGLLTQNSDRRLKTQIQPLGTSVLDPLGKIEPVRFQFKDERTHPSGEQIGLIAQEVQAQFPHLVSEGASGYLSVSYSKFTAVLLKGLQEQQVQLQKQQEQIEQLRGQNKKIAALQAEVEALKKWETQDAGWDPVAGGLLGLLLLGGGVVAVWRWRTPHAASMLALAGMGALIFGIAPASAQTVSVKNGATVSMQNGGVFDLGTNTVLVEEESSGARLTGGTGVITATRTLNAPSSTDVAGLGAVITASQNLGQTTITRGHAVQTDNNNESIARYYDIQPGQNNSGLNATLQFTYTDAELNGLSESSLILFRSGDDGSTYTTAGYDSRDASANTVTLSGIDSFSRWTLGSESQPLPVEWAGFEVTRSDNSVRLQWATAFEKQNAGFEVQRRRTDAPNGAWKEIGFVASQAAGGTTNEPKSYRFADTDLPFEADSLTYRLRQVDSDGNATLSDPVVVGMSAPKKLILHGAAPNPVRGPAILRYEVPERASVRIELFDVLGRRVTTLVDRKEAAGRKTTAIDPSSLSSGTYFVRLQAEGSVRTEQITVVR